jgi:hypothetical protein
MSFKIPEQPAFYKQTMKPSEYWAVGLHKVINENFELLIENHGEYKYPVDGWFYAATPPQEFIEWVERNTPEPIEPPTE